MPTNQDNIPSNNTTDSNPSPNENQRIPKTIHYCWFGGNPLLPMNLECIESWHKYLPDYQFVRWDESNSPIDAVPFVRRAYSEKMWAFVSDYVRIYALLNEGGIYMDTDMLLLKSLDPFLSHRAFAAFENLKELGVAIFGDERHHPFLSLCMDWYNSRKFNPYHPPRNPKVITKILRQKGLSKYGRQQIFDVDLYQIEYFYSLPFRNRMQRADYHEFVTPETVAVHLWNKTWAPKDSIVSKVSRYLKPFFRSFYKRKAPK
ncbi:MAG: hypothetical protein LBQ66_02795 [Planctomycetaceae bacterium]|jgi:mannosyltransferase OCH1-like enzyme|nr:hypothetical protein [Planctomycetaceae bacterium]